jgi:hypothetical protein
MVITIWEWDCRTWVQYLHFPSIMDGKLKGLLYSIFNDLASFFCQLAKVLQHASSKEKEASLTNAPDCKMFPETALAEGDSTVRDGFVLVVPRWSVGHLPQKERHKLHSEELFIPSATFQRKSVRRFRLERANAER